MRQKLQVRQPRIDEEKDKRSRHQPAKKSRSRHQSQVATSVDTKGGRDIIQHSRHHEQKERGRDNIQRSRHQLRRLEVATPLSSRNNRSKERRSRHQSVVATSTAKEPRSRHHPVVATISYKGRKVATTVRDRDSRCTDQKVATSYSSHDIKYKEMRS